MAQQKTTLAPEDLVCLAEMEALPVSWLWKGYLAYGMLTMLSGDPEAGKTFIALAIAADLSNGRLPVSGKPCAPIATLYLSRENAAQYVTRPRFDAQGGDAKRFHLLTRPGITLKDVGALEEALQKTRAGLIVIDPIQSYLGADVDAWRSNETRPIMDGLIGLAEKYNASVLLIRHLTKAAGSRAIYRGQGSIDLTGAVRMEMIAGNEADNPHSRALVPVKSNLGPRADSLGYEIVGEEMVARLEWRGKSHLTSRDLLDAPCDPKDRGALEEAREWLSDFLSGGCKEQKECKSEAAKVGIAYATLRRAKVALGVQPFKLAMTSPWFWQLPEAAQPAPKT